MYSDFRTEGGSATNLEWPKVFLGVLLARFAKRFSDEPTQGLPHGCRSDSAILFAGHKELGADQVWGAGGAHSWLRGGVRSGCPWARGVYRHPACEHFVDMSGGELRGEATQEPRRT